MILTNDQLDDIEQFGAAFFSPRQIAIVLQIDYKELQAQMKKETSPAYQRYHKGRLQSIYLVRKSEIDLAGRGSSQAQELAERHFKNLELHSEDD
jgi:hypothetical protein